MPTTDPTDRRTLPGCFLGLVTQLVAVSVALGVLACGSGVGAAAAPLLGPLAPLGGLLCFAASAPVVGLAAGLWLRRRLTAPLDRAFAPLDAAPRRFMLSGRAWLGERGGRAVQVTMMRGPVVQLTVACDARTKFSAGRRSALSSGVAGLAGLTELPLPGAGGELAVFAADAEWVGGLLTDAAVVDALRRLAADDGLARTRAVNVEADCVMLTLHRPMAAPGPDEAMALVDDLGAVAAAIEARPPPSSTAPPGMLRALRPAPLRVTPRAG